MAIYLENELAKQLVFKANIGNGKVDQGHFGTKLGREVGARQTRRTEQPEAFCVSDLYPISNFETD